MFGQVGGSLRRLFVAKPECISSDSPSLAGLQQKLIRILFVGKGKSGISMTYLTIYLHRKTETVTDLFASAKKAETIEHSRQVVRSLAMRDDAYKQEIIEDVKSWVGEGVYTASVDDGTVLLIAIGVPRESC